MADIGIKYGTAVAVTVTGLQSLASSSTRVAGWSGPHVDNGTDQNLDFLVSGTFKVHNTNAPTAGKTISVYAYAAHDGGGSPVWPNVFPTTGTEGQEGVADVADEEERDSSMRLLWSGVVDTSTGAEHHMPPTSIAEAFGGIPPRRWALWVTQDTGQALHSSGNALYYTPVEGVST